MPSREAKNSAKIAPGTKVLGRIARFKLQWPAAPGAEPAKPRRDGGPGAKCRGSVGREQGACGGGMVAFMPMCISAHTPLSFATISAFSGVSQALCGLLNTTEVAPGREAFPEPPG